MSTRRAIRGAPYISESSVTEPYKRNSSQDESAQASHGASTRRRPRPLAILAILVPLALMVVAVSLFATVLRPAVREQVVAPTTGGPSQAPSAASSERTAGNEADKHTASAAFDASAVAPKTPWLPLAPQTTLTRIGVGSCIHQNHPQPLWTDIIADKPQLFLAIGDNVYGDVKSADMTELIAAYRTQLGHPEFAAARKAIPFLATWDDHDYGANDAGASFAHRERAAALFHAFWQIPANDGSGSGISYARTYGPEGRRVQIIMLDTRSFRSPLTRKTETFPHWGKYEPDPAPSRTMLGAQQWRWLETELRKPAEIRLVVSSIQVLAEGHGWERWGNLSAERDRLIALIEKTGATGVIMLSGDRHMGAVYEREIAGPRLIAELTASSINRSYGPSKDAVGPPLVSDRYHAENYGLIEIDWAARTLRLSLKGLSGKTHYAREVAFSRLGMDG